MGRACSRAPGRRARMRCRSFTLERPLLMRRRIGQTGRERLGELLDQPRQRRHRGPVLDVVGVDVDVNGRERPRARAGDSLLLLVVDAYGFVLVILPRVQRRQVAS